MPALGGSHYRNRQVRTTGREGRPHERLTMTTLKPLTLRDVVQTIREYTISDEEVVATVAPLINSGRVLRGGNFAGARIDLSALPAPPFSSTTSPRRRHGLSVDAALNGDLLPPLASQVLTARRRLA